MHTTTPGTLRRTLVLMLAALSIAPASADAGSKPCMGPDHPQGEWPSPGHDTNNTRTQPLETQVGPSNVAELRLAWAFDTGDPPGYEGAPSDFNGTPIVDGGCVFVGSSHGRIIALDADDGSVVWEHRVLLRPGERAGLAGIVPASLAVTNDHVVAMINRETSEEGVGPYALGLDRSTGAERWVSDTVQTQPLGYTNANPVIAHDLLVFGYSALEGQPGAQGGFAVIDTRNGEILAITPTVPEEDQESFSGGGVWSAPAVDAQTRRAYIGTGNPYSKQVEHERTNALLEVDLRRGSKTVGGMLDSYKGESDQGEELIYEATRPTCALVGDERTVIETYQELRPEQLDPLRHFEGTVTNSQACGQLNLAFGAGPNLFEIDGEPVVGALHKSGYYHVVQRDAMERVWRTRVAGYGCEVCNAASTAFDGDRIYASVTPGPTLRALASATGEILWTTPLFGDAGNYHPLSSANGVLYVLDEADLLRAYDTATGQLLTARSVPADTTTGPAGTFASGIAIARGTVFVLVGSKVLAYRLEDRSSRDRS